MAKFIITKEQSRRPNSWALGQLLGQKSDGSADDFSILTTANLDADKLFDDTYTVEIPDGRATREQVQAVLDDPNPPQPPRPAPTTRETAQAKIDDGTATVDDVIEVLKTR